MKGSVTQNKAPDIAINKTNEILIQLSNEKGSAKDRITELIGSALNIRVTENRLLI